MCMFKKDGISWSGVFLCLTVASKGQVQFSKILSMLFCHTTVTMSRVANRVRELW